MTKADLLIEIGVEEIPVDSIAPATRFIKESFEKMLAATELVCDELRLDSTPRRFVLDCRALDVSQQDRTLQKTGPSISIAYNADGSPAPALLGFLKKNSASLDELSTLQTEKGEFVSLTQHLKGLQSTELISKWFIEMLPQIPFPKKMIWNDAKLGFIRPLRWILALWGNEILPITAFGISSGRISYGNRYLGLDNEHVITSSENYYSTLLEQAVIVDRDSRKAMITEQLGSVFEPGTGLRVMEDSRLVDTVTDLVEYPTAVVGDFDPGYLELPDKVITSTISQNQKYFSVLDSEGRLSNHFVFISNGDKAFSDLIRQGNEKVVKARLADAFWYFKEDSSKPLDSYLARLEEIVFQSKLGTMAAKSRRIEELCAYITDLLGLDEQSRTRTIRAARLAKADLVTNMLGEKEFTKLQGYIGKQYALASGEDAEVAEAIYEHYMPRGQNDSLPTTITGSIVAIADKLDTVCGIIGIGMMPTGSADPYALRRAANGIVQIIADQSWQLDLQPLIDRALELLARDAGVDPKVSGSIFGFMQARLNWLLQQLGIDYDVVDSVLLSGAGKVTELKDRALALQAFRNREDFVRLVIAFKRVANIIAKEKALVSLDPTLFDSDAERVLHAELLKLQSGLAELLSQHSYSKALELLVDYGRHIDRFFDEVLVNVEEQAIRQNRYALLNEIKQEFLKLADISVLVVEQS